MNILMKNVLLLFISFAFIVSCGNKKQKTDSGMISDTLRNENYFCFDLESTLKNGDNYSDTVSLNSIAKNISFFHADEEQVLSDMNLLCSQINDEFIISSGVVNNVSDIMSFNRDGTFKKKLISKGRGPGEILSYYLWNLNHNCGELTVCYSSKVVSHSLKEGKSKDIILPYHASEAVALNDGNYVSIGPVFGIPEYDAPYLTFFNDRGEILSELHYPDGENKYIEVSEGMNIWPLDSYGLSQSYNGDALFHDLLNDTIFRITALNEVEPYINISRGRFFPEKKYMTDVDKNRSFVFFRNILESEKYILVKYIYNEAVYCSIWDKSSNEMVTNSKIALTDNENMAIKHAPGFIKYHTPNGEEINVGIVSLTKDKMYCAVSAHKVKEFLTDQNEESNPTIMVVEL